MWSEGVPMQMGLVVLSALVLASCAAPNGDKDEPPIDCSNVSGVDTFVDGLEKIGSNKLVDFRLLSIDPSPPTRGDNTWRISMETGSPLAPIDGANISVSSRMPEYDLDSPVNPIVTPTSTLGEYEIEPVNLWMPGTWEVTIDVSGPQSDHAAYRFCVL
jgi:hypothetical protein